MALLSSLMGVVGWFLIPFSGWLLAGLGPVGLLGFCGAFVSGSQRVDGLAIAVDGCLEV